MTINENGILVAKQLVNWFLIDANLEPVLFYQTRHNSSTSNTRWPMSIIGHAGLPSVSLFCLSTHTLHVYRTAPMKGVMWTARRDMHKAENSLEYLHQHTCNYQWTTQPIFIFPVYNSVLSLPLCVYTNTVKCRLRSRADSLFSLLRTHTCFLPIGEFEHVCTRIQEIHLSLYSMISLISPVH